MNTLRRNVHPSWLFAAMFFGIVLGVMGSRWMPGSAAVSAAWLFNGSLLAGLGFWRRRAYLLPMMMVAGSMLGLWRGSIYKQQLVPYASLTGRVVTVQGSVTDDAEKGKRGEVVVRVGKVSINGRPMPGNLWISIDGQAPVRRSDVVTVKGKLADGFASFAGSMYRAELIKVQRPEPGDVALRVRDWFTGGVRRSIAEPEASLGVGYVTGQHRSLPDDLDKALRAAGLTHIVVASGYNLTILVEASRRLFARVSKFMAAFCGGGLIVGFVAVTGFSPSMSRAGLVAGLGLVAWYYGRRFHPFVLLPLAAAVTLLVNPAYGWGDLGWQLSFAAFAGVLIVGPLLQNFFFGEAESGIIRQILGETISAWLCTLPLIILAFGQFSNVAIVANLLILPVVPIAMLLTFVAGIGSLVLPSTALFVGFPAQLVLGYTTRMAEYLGGLSWAQTDVSVPPTALVVYCVLLAGLCGYMWHCTRFDFAGRTSRRHDTV